MKKNIIRDCIILGIAIMILVFAIFFYMSTTSVKNIKPNKDVSKSNEEPKRVEEQPQDTEIENSEFELSFLKLENKKENSIYSPLSIKYALKLLNEGADVETKKEIDNVIGENELTNYENIEKVLSLANGIYIRENWKENVKEEYIKSVKNKYSSEVLFDKFENAENINSWIENKTFKLIQNMLKDEDVQNEENKMILINALAIDMEWETKFDPKDTFGRDFYTEDGNKIEATTLSRNFSSENLNYYLDDEVTAIKLNLKKYEDTQLEFMAIMPNEKLDEYVETVSLEKIEEIEKNMKPATEIKKGVDLTIPKFKFDYSLKLKEDLSSLGIKEAFTPEANFSKMSKEDLYVSKALHKANIEFSEEGIKAAAVTAFMMEMGALIENEKPLNIDINKPFMFIIKDKSSNDIWFVGKVYEPNLWEKDKAAYHEDYGF